MATLSVYTQQRIIESFASVDDETGIQAGQEFINAVQAKSVVGLGSYFKMQLNEWVTSDIFGQEIFAAISSGNSLSHEAQRRICIALTDEVVAGPEVINAIQTIQIVSPFNL